MYIFPALGIISTIVWVITGNSAFLGVGLFVLGWMTGALLNEIWQMRPRAGRETE